MKRYYLTGWANPSDARGRKAVSQIIDTWYIQHIVREIFYGKVKKHFKKEKRNNLVSVCDIRYILKKRRVYGVSSDIFFISFPIRLLSP